jgi:hypothetical protein
VSFRGKKHGRHAKQKDYGEGGKYPRNSSIKTGSDQHDAPFPDKGVVILSLAGCRFLRRRGYSTNQPATAKQLVPAARNARLTGIVTRKFGGGPGSPMPTSVKKVSMSMQTPTEHKRAMANQRRRAAQNRSVFCAFKATLSCQNNERATQNCNSKFYTENSLFSAANFVRRTGVYF